MTDGSNTNRDDLAEFLARSFAGGPSGSPRKAGRAELPDENDVAAYVRGGLLPRRRSSLVRALHEDPALRDAVLFEKGVRRRRRLRVAASAGAAAAVLLLATIPFLSGGADAVVEARRLIAGGDLTAAARLLEEACAGAPSTEMARLLALCRYARGEPDPTRGLDLPEADRTWLPLRAQEVAELEPPVVRGARRPALGGPRGRIISDRPVLIVRLGPVPLRLTLFRFEDQEELLSETLAPGEPGEVVRLPFPDTTGPLERGCVYGVELRDPQGRVVADSDFEVAPLEVLASYSRRVDLIRSVVGDPARQHEAVGNLFLREGFYADARDAYRAIPEALRAPVITRVLATLERRLWQ